MHVIVDNVITIENPTKEIYYWVKRNLEFPNPEYVKKQRMGLWTGDTPKVIYLYHIDGDSIIIPYGCFREIIPFIEKGDTTYEVPLKKYKSYVDYDTKIPLRDYQEKAVKEMIECEYGILQSPAGSGKTQMGIAILSELKEKTLWITHTKDLLNQTRDRALQYMDASLIGTITEGKVNIGKGLTIATVQTLCNIDLQLFKNTWQCIIVDECHRVAGSAANITQFSKVLENLAAIHKFGLSATVHRSDGLIKSTYSLLGRVMHVVPDEEVSKFVMDVTINFIPTSTTLDELNGSEESTDGTIDYTELLTYLCADKMRNKIISNKLKTGLFNSNLILSDRISHLETLMDMLPENFKSKAVLIDGKSKKEIRQKAIEDMRRGNKKYLFATYTLAKEGLDIPRLDRLYLVTPKKDEAVIIQSIGRIARIFEDKKDAICYDFVDNIGQLINAYKERRRIYKKQKYTMK